MKINLLKKFSSKGFTLIELLVVIAVLGVLATAVLIGIDPVDKINAANDAKVQNDLSGSGRAAEAYATARGGFYPANLGDLVTAGELKSTPAAPSGYSTYAIVNIPSGCTAGVTCTGITITSQLKAKKFTQASPATPFWRFESSTGKSCATTTAATACP